MTDRPTGKAPTPPRGQTAPASIERMRLLRSVLVRHGGAARVKSFAKGDILVRQGESLDGTMAMLVISGSLSERMTRFVKGRGQMPITICSIPPSAITNIQVLEPYFATQPSMITIVAEEDGEVILFGAPQIGAFKEFGVILNGEMRTRMQVLDNLYAQREVEVELEEAVFGLKITESDLARERTRSDDLAKSAERQREIAREARAKMAEAVEALDNERLRMTNVGLGMELYIDRIREEMVRLELPAKIRDRIACILTFTHEEAQLFTGEKPSNIGDLRARVLRAREIYKIDDGVDELVSAFLDEGPTDQLIELGPADPDETIVIDPDDAELIEDDAAFPDSEATTVRVDATIEPAEEVTPVRFQEPETPSARYRGRMETLNYEDQVPDPNPQQKRKGIASPAPGADPDDADDVGRTTAAFEVPTTIRHIVIGGPQKKK